MGFGVLVVAGAITGAVLLPHPADNPPSAAPHLPRVTVPPPSTAAPTGPPQGSQRQRAKLRPPVLLGPKDLATSLIGYCKDKVGPNGSAATTDDGWRCYRKVFSQRLIDMDAACRWLYGDEAWAGMLNDDDQSTWRCYRDPS